jgi:hypothetical protein
LLRTEDYKKRSREKKAKSEKLLEIVREKDTLLKKDIRKET